MVSVRDWVDGARPRTLPAAVAPVAAGTGAAAYDDGVVWWKALLALVVALALQVGVNFANDYSDGVRGTDADRVGPRRLVGSGSVAPAVVRTAALGGFAVGALAGLVLAATSGWWLLGVGAAAIAAAWFYTGGSRPYGYHGLGEVTCFVFFGLVAVCGTTYVQLGQVTVPSLLAAIGAGALACVLLVANNLRDIPTDRVAGKRTLAVLLDDRGTRGLFVALMLVAVAVPVLLAGTTSWVLLAALALPVIVRASRPVLAGAAGSALIPVLRDSALAQLVWALGLGLGLALGG
ncbi:MAG: 1,4-dihydroxy-2-naphthoate polyprenyltransferase [Nocardioidaceae bacterium]|nr:1,4-dihydroxy-2-naphthoate polyprenyltransferase [Nocardioidaceae bacterium]